MLDVVPVKVVVVFKRIQSFCSPTLRPIQRRADDTTQKEFPGVCWAAATPRGASISTATIGPPPTPTDSLHVVVADAQAPIVFALSAQTVHHRRSSLGPLTNIKVLACQNTKNYLCAVCPSISQDQDVSAANHRGYF